MALPHYSNDQTSKKGKNFEPVLMNMFEVTILPPAGVGGQEMLLQHVKGITGLDLHKAGDPIAQKFKWSTRSFAGTPADSHLDVEITFTLNLNEANQMYAYKTIRDWQRLQYNPETGETGLKKDYVGQIVIVQFNRAGDIYRKITLEDCFIGGAVNPGTDLSYDNAEPQELAVSWRCDTWSEELV
tara:strand:+ start:12226 stop:12780 length:555 start_codon:yes stop_codon:yes gene_type:complete